MNKLLLAFALLIFAGCVQVSPTAGVCSGTECGEDRSDNSTDNSDNSVTTTEESDTEEEAATE